MKIEWIARILLGAAACCLLLVSAGCNSMPAPSGSVPIASVQGRGDWGMRLLAGGTVGVGMFPAKFTFDVTAVPSCANDYVAFNTSLAGVVPTTAATQTIPNTFGIIGTPSGHITITQQAASLTLTAGTSNLGTNFKVVANLLTGATTNAASLAARINALGSTVGVVAASSGANVTISDSNLGIGGNSITVTSTLTFFTVGSSPLSGGVGTGTIIAYNDLYSTQGSANGLCNHDGPTVYWAYTTGTGSIVTSVVLSGDGTKVAFVANVGNQAFLRILQWAPDEGTGVGHPVVPQLTLANGTSWASGCPPVAGGGMSCMSSIQFSNPVTGPVTDTNSSAFYNYSTDTIYVGDDKGQMHKFTGVFLGTPAEVTTSFPIAVNAGSILTSPVYDSVSGNIFVGDSTGRLSFIREVGSTVGAACTMPCLSTTNLIVGSGAPIVDGPIVDGTNGTVFVVTGTGTSNHGTILQANTSLTGNVSLGIGGGSKGAFPLYSGTFDNTYFNSAKGATTGHMYVCGKDHSNSGASFADRPAIYQLSFTAAGVLSGVGTTPLLNLVTKSGEACSPVTEFDNPNGGGAGVEKDWIFFSIGNAANNAAPMPVVGGCGINGAGCVISVDVTGNPAWPPSAVANTAPVPGNSAGSTSGIIVDNEGTAIGVGAPFVQASSIYFSLGTNSIGAGPGVPSCNTTAGVGCAVKLTQALLK